MRRSTIDECNSQAGELNQAAPASAGASHDLAIQKICEFNEELVAKGWLPRLRFRKGQRDTSTIEQSVYAAEAPCVSHISIHDVANGILQHLALLIEGQGAGLRWRNDSLS